jgi:DNA-binding Lrp family transcriptional regulator
MSEQDPTALPLFCQEKSSGLWIPDEILRHPDLSPAAKLLAAQICAYKGRGCFRSNESLAAMIGVSAKTVSRDVSDLIKRGIIRVNGNTSDRVLAMDNLSQDGVACSGQSVPSKGETRDNLSRNSGQFVQHNIKENKALLKKRGRKSSSKFTPPTLEQVRDYIQQHPKLSRIDPQGFIDFYESMNPPWSDSKGNPVRSWKGKLLTWSHYGNARNTSPKAHRTDFENRTSIHGKTIQV